MTAARRLRPSRVSHRGIVCNPALQRPVHGSGRALLHSAASPNHPHPAPHAHSRRGGARVGGQQQGFAVRRRLLALREQELDRVLRLQNGLRTQRRRKLR